MELTPLARVQQATVVALVEARVIDASESGPAVRAIVVDAATDRGRALYARFGFVAVPGRGDRMIVRAETIAKGLRQA